ncbi:MAG: hypothetical protein KGL15_08350 [Acidobacteriota bacterium]|nr:hypothetical protein [Acidobacteriota bacterium]
MRIAGGFSGRTLLASAELFDPATGAFTALPAPMTAARFGAVAAPLPDGNVLIAGGDDGRNVLSSAEVFDPAPVYSPLCPGRWSLRATGRLRQPCLTAMF